MRKKKLKVLVILFFLAAALHMPVTAYASGTDSIENDVDESNNDRFGGTSPWLSGSQDDSIYGNAIDAGEEEQDISVEKPGRVEKYIAELFRNIGSALISVLQDSIGASIDTIVYGRVGSGQPNKVNIYAFELRKGNPYGVTAAVCYALLRGLMFIFLGIYFVFQLAKAAWSGHTAKSRDEIKAILPEMALKFSALILMPHLLDVALYVRDVLLYGIKEVTGQMVTGGATLSLSKAFLLNAERSGTFVDAVMYLGTVVLTIYFVFLYVATAIDMLVCFVSFPFICVMHSKKRDLAGGWIMTVFSNLMTPVIDAVLLLIPLLTSLMLSDVVKGVSIIQLVMCMLIIPARVRFKALLGIQSNERNGFLGAMAVMTFARALAGRIKQGAGKIADAVSDVKKSRMHGELAEIDREEEQALLSGDGGKKDNPAPGTGGGIASADSGRPAEQENGRRAQESNLQSGMGMSVPEESGIRETATEEGGAQEDISFRVPEGHERTTREDIPAGSVNEAVRAADRQVDDSQNRLDNLRMERAKLVQKDKQLRRQMLDCRRGSEEYRSLEKERADVEEQTAQMDSRIAVENGRLNQLRGQAKELHAAAGTRNTPTEFADRRAEILRKRANISNFEQPEFRGVLTNEQMRELYRKRAIANTAKAAAGTTGAVAVGMTAGASAIYLGGSGAAMASAGGMHAGGAAGEAAVDVATEVGRMAAPVFKAAGRSAYQAADMAASAYLMNKIRPAAMQVPVDYTGMSTGTASTTHETSAPNAVASGERDTMPDTGSDRIAQDAGSAIQRIMTPQGSPRNSAALRAMQQATLQLEREIAVMKEEGSVVVTQELIREKRIETQTAALSAEILRQMEQKQGYEKGTQAYTDAQNLIQKKIYELLEEKNKPLV